MQGNNYSASGGASSMCVLSVGMSRVGLREAQENRALMQRATPRHERMESDKIGGATGGLQRLGVRPNPLRIVNANRPQRVLVKILQGALADKAGRRMADTLAQESNPRRVADFIEHAAHHGCVALFVRGERIGRLTNQTIA
jgi:hypothetical protein